MNNWKDKFDKFRDNAENYSDYPWACRECGGGLVVNNVEDFITKLLEEQRKELYSKDYYDGYNQSKEDLINKILSEAPEDRDTAGVVTPYTNYGFNQANAQWREIINNISNK